MGARATGALSGGGSSRRAVRARIVLALAEPAAASARVAADLGVTLRRVTSGDSDLKPLVWTA